MTNINRFYKLERFFIFNYSAHIIFIFEKSNIQSSIMIDKIYSDDEIHITNEKEYNDVLNNNNIRIISHPIGLSTIEHYDINTIYHFFEIYFFGV
jgi:hypothetical protein